MAALFCRVVGHSLFEHQSTDGLSFTRNPGKSGSVQPVWRGGTRAHRDQITVCNEQTVWRRVGCGRHVGRFIRRSGATALTGAFALAAALTLAPGPAVAEVCLLDTFNEGVTTPFLDTDGGATSSSTGLACGDSATATGLHSVAVGEISDAAATDSTAIGYDAYAAGPYSTAIGAHSTAWGLQSTATGGVQHRLGRLQHGDRV